MIDFLRWALITLGVIYLVTEAIIFAPVRLALRYKAKSYWFTVLVYCRSCVGFWAGFGLGLAGLWFVPDRSLLESGIESGFAAMALGALWSGWAPSAAWANENMDEVGDDNAPESKDE